METGFTYIVGEKTEKVQSVGKDLPPGVPAAIKSLSFFDRQPKFDIPRGVHRIVAAASGEAQIPNFMAHLHPLPIFPFHHITKRRGMQGKKEKSGGDRSPPQIICAYKI